MLQPLSIISCIGRLYPQFTTANEVIHYIERLPERYDKSSPLYTLCHFIRCYSKLEAIGSCLPELVEFYNFLFSDLSQTISKDQALEGTLKDKIDECVRKYEKSYHLLELYNSVKGKNKAGMT